VCAATLDDAFEQIRKMQLSLDVSRQAEARQRVNRQRVVGMVLVLAGKQISIDQRLPRGCCQVIYT
jgi:hypothetical protein